MLASANYEGLIIDLGVSEGNDTAYYLSKGFQVIAVEADPSMCEKLKVRFASELASGSLRLINCAAAQEFGNTVPIFVHNVHQGLSGIGKRGDVPDNYTKYNVTTVDWITLIAQLGVPRYLKIDIEGNEEPFLLGMLGTRVLPEFISVECYKLRPIEILRDLGYRRFKLVDQKTPTGFVLPKKQFEGQTVETADFYHSTGPFGLDIFSDGEWLDWTKCVVAWETASQSFATTWFDCHAWRPQ